MTAPSPKEKGTFSIAYRNPPLHGHPHKKKTGVSTNDQQTGKCAPLLGGGDKPKGRNCRYRSIADGTSPLVFIIFRRKKDRRGSLKRKGGEFFFHQKNRQQKTAEAPLGGQKGRTGRGLTRISGGCKGMDSTAQNTGG